MIETKHQEKINKVKFSGNTVISFGNHEIYLTKGETLLKITEEKEVKDVLLNKDESQLILLVKANDEQPSRIKLLDIYPSSS